jgi:hypothetical protein
MDIGKTQTSKLEKRKGKKNTNLDLGFVPRVASRSRRQNI